MHVLLDLQRNRGNSRLSVQAEPGGGNLLEVDTAEIVLKLVENSENLYLFRLCIYLGWLGEVISSHCLAQLLGRADEKNDTQVEEQLGSLQYSSNLNRFND